MKSKIFYQLLIGLLSLFFFSASVYGQKTKNGKKILIVLSAADHWTRADGSLYSTGYWAEEFIDVHKEFVEQGYQVDIASPGAVKPTADEKSLSPKTVGDKEAAYFRKYLADLSAELNKPLKLSEVKMKDYIAIVIPGGHGPVEDLYKDKDMGRLLFEAEKTGKIIGAVCHGPAAFLSAVDNKGNWLFKDRTMTAFTDEEEVEFGTADNAPWLLASTLRKRGAKFIRGEKNWDSYVIRDKNLITGQNPASSLEMAKKVVEALTENK